MPQKSTEFVMYIFMISGSQIRVYLLEYNIYIRVLYHHAKCQKYYGDDFYKNSRAQLLPNSLAAIPSTILISESS
jgi:hypothetical protein